MDIAVLLHRVVRKNRNVFYIDKSPGNGDSLNFEDIKLKGYFSMDITRSILFDSSKLLWVDPKLFDKIGKLEKTMNLRLGSELVIKKKISFTDEHLDSILQWMQKNPDDIVTTKNGKQMKPHFVLWRGTLSTILKTPYLKAEESSWIICAAKWKGIIYLSPYNTEYKKLAKANLSPRQLQTMYWGLKFRQYLLTDTPRGTLNTWKPVDENDQFCGVFQSRLGDHQLLYAAAMDGAYPIKTDANDPLPLDALKFVSIKTNRAFDDDQYTEFFKEKTLGWWTKNVLVDVKDTIIGYRNDRGFVEEIAIASLPDLVEECSKGIWSPAVSKNFCNEFLNHVIDTVVDDCDKVVYKFEKEMNGNIHMTKFPATSEWSFLPKWYTHQSDEG